MEALPNLLIVDDTEENLAFLEAIIRRTRVNLIQALSGEEALRKTAGMKLALAIIDVRMPVMNGYELAIRMNQEMPEEKPPIIFLTANHGDEEEISKGYACGAVDYLFKPISPHILLSKINAFLEIYNQKEIISRDAELLRKSADVLSRVNGVISRAEAKYRSYIDHAPDGVFVVDDNWRFVEVNAAGCAITGYTLEELYTLPVASLVLTEPGTPVISQLQEGIESGSTLAEFRFRRKDGAIRWLNLEAVRLSRTRYLAFAKDITGRKLMEERLEENNQLLAGILENTYMMAVYLDPMFNFIWVNRTYAETCRMDQASFKGKNHFDLFPDEENEAIFRLVVESGEPYFVEAKPFVFPDQPNRGMTYWDWSLFAVKDEKGNVTGLVFTLAEVTGRIRAENEVKDSLEKLHQLGRYVEQVRESERVALSRELHDDLGQSLTAIKIDLGMIRKKVADPEVLSRLSKTADLVSSTIKTVQRLTSELRPQIIEDLGLAEAVSWYAGDFRERTGIGMELNLDKQFVASSRISLVFFRILQESLTNVARHSQATRVIITLSGSDGWLRLRISDNGKGITAEQVSARDSFGIISMQERALSLGGALAILPGTEGGTEVSLDVPLTSD